MSTNTAGGNAQFRKFSKFLKVMPLVSIPIWMTFPAAFNIYWLVTSSMQLLTLNAFRSHRFRKFMGLKDYLPGSKLERLNTKNFTREVFKPTVHTTKPVATQKKILAAKKAAA